MESESEFSGADRSSKQGKGDVLPKKKEGEPRAILSPANGFSSKDAPRLGVGAT